MSSRLTLASEACRASFAGTLLLTLSLLGCSAEVANEVCTDAGTAIATRAIVTVGYTYAMVTYQFSDGRSPPQEVVDTSNPTPVCDPGYNEVPIVDLGGDPLTICIPSNLTCPPMTEYVGTHQPSDVMTAYCEVKS